MISKLKSLAAVTVRTLKRVVGLHIEKETLSVAVNVPSHDVRGSGSALFERTRKQLLARDHVCYICGSIDKLEAHHYPIEWSFTNMVDFGPSGLLRKDFPYFDWVGFDPTDPYSFVDNMLVNGLLLCKAHHIEKDEGIHSLPHPIWIAQRYGKENYTFSDVEVIHHIQIPLE